MTKHKVQGHIALVDGADVSANLAVAKKLLGKGAAKVVAVCDDETALTALKEQYSDRLIVCKTKPNDDGTPDRDPVGTALKSLEETHKDVYDDIDIFVSRAPVVTPGAGLEHDLETTYQVLDRTAQAVHHVSNIMLRHGKPSDIQILNGTGGEHPEPGQPCLSACHRFLELFTKGVDVSLEQHATNNSKAKNIRVGEQRFSESIFNGSPDEVAGRVKQAIQVSRDVQATSGSMVAHGQVSQPFSIAPRTKLTDAQVQALRAENPLQGKVIAITGATDGIGRAYAEYLAEKGVKIVAIGRSLEKLDDFPAHLTHMLHKVKLDVSDSEAAQRAFAALPEGWQNIDVLVNNAGFDLQGGVTFPDTNIANISQVIGCNVRGAIACTYAVLPGMQERGFGDVVFTGSTAGEQAYGAPIYCGTKIFAETYSRALHSVHNRSETAPNIRFPCTAFGVTATHFAETRFAHLPETQRVEAVKKTYEAEGLHPLQPRDCCKVLEDMLTLPRNVSMSPFFHAGYQQMQGLGASYVERLAAYRQGLSVYVPPSALVSRNSLSGGSSGSGSTVDSPGYTDSRQNSNATPLTPGEVSHVKMLERQAAAAASQDEHRGH